MPKNAYLFAIDQGTTGTTVLILSCNKDIVVIGKANCEFTQHYPQKGYVEHDLEQIWASFEKAAKLALKQAKDQDKNFSPNKIAAIGITNQRETLAVFARKTLKPKRKAIVWQDKRSTDICKQLNAENLAPLIKEKTGLLIDPYFSGTKIKWLLENDDALAKEITKGNVILSTIDCYLLAKLTKGEAIYTEPSNASRTLLMDLKKGAWDQELLRVFGLPNQDCLPEIKNSVDNFGQTKGIGFLPDGIPIQAMLGDQQAALAGQGCYEPGLAKCTYGTGSFLLIQNGQQLRYSQKGMLTTVAWSIDNKLSYALEGSAFIAGASIQFLRDQLLLVKNASESEELAAKETAAPFIYFVPALAGLGAPYWNPNARGAFLGLSRDTSKGQLIRAALEAMAFQVYDLVKTAELETKLPLKALRVDGGAVANNLLLQIQANLLGKEVQRPQIIETTSYGAAIFAGLGAGIFGSLAELAGISRIEQTFSPDLKHQDACKQMIKGWQQAIDAVLLFAQGKKD